MNKFKMQLTENARVVSDDEIEYCSMQEGFAQMDEANKRAQKALDEMNNFGKGTL